MSYKLYYGLPLFPTMPPRGTIPFPFPGASTSSRSEAFTKHLPFGFPSATALTHQACESVLGWEVVSYTRWVWGRETEGGMGDSRSREETRMRAWTRGESGQTGEDSGRAEIAGNARAQIETVVASGL